MTSLQIGKEITNEEKRKKADDYRIFLTNQMKDKSNMRIRTANNHTHNDYVSIEENKNNNDFSKNLMEELINKRTDINDNQPNLPG